jgi:hypothetical protein
VITVLMLCPPMVVMMTWLWISPVLIELIFPKNEFRFRSPGIAVLKVITVSLRTIWGKKPLVSRF